MAEGSAMSTTTMATTTRKVIVAVNMDTSDEDTRYKYAYVCPDCLQVCEGDSCFHWLVLGYNELYVQPPRTKPPIPRFDPYEKNVDKLLRQAWVRRRFSAPMNYGVLCCGQSDPSQPGECSGHFVIDPFSQPKILTKEEVRDGEADLLDRLAPMFPSSAELRFYEFTLAHVLGLSENSDLVEPFSVWPLPRDTAAQTPRGPNDGGEPELSPKFYWWPIDSHNAYKPRDLPFEDGYVPCHQDRKLFFLCSSTVGSATRQFVMAIWSMLYTPPEDFVLLHVLAGL